MRRRLALLLVAGSALLPAPALAQPAPHRPFDAAPEPPPPPAAGPVSVRLDYARAPGAEACPDERATRGAIAARLGYDPRYAFAFAPWRARVSLAGSVRFCSAL
jgi:hypothetical protein